MKKVKSIISSILGSKSDPKAGIIWPNTAPRVVNTTTINDVFTFNTEVAFDKSCPKHLATPPIYLTLNNKKITHYPLNKDKPISDHIKVGVSSDNFEFTGSVQVNYDFGCVYFGTGSELSHNDDPPYNLDGIVIISWRPQTFPVFLDQSNKRTKDSIPYWVNNIHNTLTIGFINEPDKFLEIDTLISSPGSEKSNISITVKNPISDKTYILTPNILSTPLILMEPGDYYPGLNSMIKVDYNQGCTYFDNDDQDPVLIKPTNENDEYGNFPIRFVKISDWLGKAIPGAI